MEKTYFDALVSSLEDAAAFAQGDSSRARVVEVETADSVPEYKAADVARTRKDLNLSHPDGGGLGGREERSLRPRPAPAVPAGRRPFPVGAADRAMN